MRMFEASSRGSISYSESEGMSLRSSISRTRHSPDHIVVEGSGVTHYGDGRWRGDDYLFVDPYVSRTIMLSSEGGASQNVKGVLRLNPQTGNRGCLGRINRVSSITFRDDDRLGQRIASFCQFMLQVVSRQKGGLYFLWYHYR